MTELISRQAVIDLFKTYQPRMATSVIEFGNALKGVPTAEITLDMVNDYCRPRFLSVVGNEVLERYKPVRHGHWIDNDIDPEAWNFCSVCGEQAIDNYDYCPNCGAKMDEEE